MGVDDISNIIDFQTAFYKQSAIKGKCQYNDAAAVYD